LHTSNQLPPALAGGKKDNISSLALAKMLYKHLLAKANTIFYI